MVNCEEYQRYIESIVRKIVGMFPGVQLSAEDMRQRGWLELIEAAGRYEEEKGVKFTTYAYETVAKGIRREALFQIAGALDMRELEVRRALQSGKRKLEELADGRQ